MWSNLLQSFFESSSDLEVFILREGGLSEIARLLPRLCERLKNDVQPCEDNRHVALALQVLDLYCMAIGCFLYSDAIGNTTKIFS